MTTIFIQNGEQFSTTYCWDVKLRHQLKVEGLIHSKFWHFISGIKVGIYDFYIILSRNRNFNSWVSFDESKTMIHNATEKMQKWEIIGYLYSLNDYLETWSS